MSKLTKICLIFIVMSLAGCSLFTPRAEPPNGLQLLPPIKSAHTIIYKQSVTFEKQNHKNQFVTVARFSPEQTKVIALLPTGQPFLYLVQDDKHFTVKNDAKIALPSKDILAMMQFTLWPKQAVIKGYPEKLGWHVEITPNTRRLYYQNTLLIGAKINGDDIIITNHSHDYTVQIHTFEKEVLAS